MKALVVRISKGEVLVEGKIVSSVKRGIALFAGIEKNDTDSELIAMADKVTNLRIFEDESGKMNYSVKDKRYQILCISNFTLCANTQKGRRPSFEQAMPLAEANKLFDDFVLVLRSKGLDVKVGIFGAHMDIDLELDGPVNIVIDSKG